jgi:hypothetical protein
MTMFSSWNSLTRSQKFQAVLCVLGVAISGSSQLEVLIGVAATKSTVALAGLLIAGISGVGAIVTGTGQQLQAVRDLAKENPQSEAGRSVVQAVVEMAKDPASPVQGVITTATPEGKELAKSIPGPIVSAGSSAATEIAKS